jgi:hypothetical protein
MEGVRIVATINWEVESMKKMMFPALAAILIASPALAGSQAPAQTPPPTTPPSTQAPAPMPEPRAARAEKAEKVKGELVKVDDAAKKLTIKSADGIETEFAYSDATEVAGGTGIAGLATKAGTKVTVHFKSDAGVKTATKIEVDDKKGS